MKIIDTPPQRTKEKILAGALNPIRELLTTKLIESWCRELQHPWREQVFGPVVTLLACIWKQLMSASARQTEDWIASLAMPDGEVTRDGSDFCAARKRLPLEIFQFAMKHVGAEASKSGAISLGTLAVWLVDGTTLRTTNTQANEEFFGRSKNAARLSRSPLARMVVLLCAGCGAVLEAAIGAYTVSEMALFGQMLLRLPSGGVIVGDTLYSSFQIFSQVRQRGSHVLSRHHPTRRSERVRRIGRNDEICRWYRPHASQVIWPELLGQSPEFLDVRVITHLVERRGYRSWTLRIVTTLTDHRMYPAHELIECYLRRWDVELDLRTLKSHYGMSALSAKTPDIVMKEIYSTLLAFNCVATMMAYTAEPPRWLSHTRAWNLLIMYSERMAAAPTNRLPQLFSELLKLISEAKLPEQERPPQPRAIVQRPSTFPVLMKTRQQWRRDYYAA